MDDPAEVAFAAYLVAKAKMHEHRPEFRIDRVGPLWCLRNHPGWPERDVYYGLRAAPNTAVESVVHDGAPPGHRITLLCDREGTGPADLPGYQREAEPQPFLCRELSSEAYEGPRAREVVDEAGVALINTPDPYMEPDDLRSGVYRYYLLLADGISACRGRCVDVEGAIYVTGLDTLPDFRHRGLGHALMRTMETDAARRGQRLSLLWSSAMGRNLYRRLGYAPWLRTDVYDEASRRVNLHP